MSVLLEYGWAPTLLHRMHPFTKLFMTVILGAIVSMWWDYRLGVPLFIIIFALTRVAKVPKHWYSIIWAAWTVYSIGRMLTFSYGYAWPFKVYPRELVERTLLKLTPQGTPIVGEIYFTVGSILFIGMELIHTGSIIMLMMIFIYSTSVMDLCDALAKLGTPSPVMFILIALYRFVAIIQRRLLTIMDAQKLRGWKLSRNPVTAIRRAAPLLYPMTHSTITMISEVTIATKIRAFGARKVAPMKILTWPNREKAMVVALVSFLGTALWAIYWSGYYIGYM